MRAVTLTLMTALALACGDSTAPGGGSTELVARGRVVYNTNCTACHSGDPAVDGSLGPGIVGSSRELVEARVLRGEYPPGYTPKRDSKLMIPLKHLAPDIDALTAFLAADAQ